MPTVYKVLGQAYPPSNTFVDLYTVPSGNSAIVSTVNFCNTSFSNVTYRLLIRPKGNTINSQQYIAYDVPIPAQDATSLSLGLTMGPTDTLTTFCFFGNVAVSAFGAEIY